MKMKKRMLLLAAAMLVCLPVWASADIFVNNVKQPPEADGRIAITAAMNGATISGSGDGVYLFVDRGVEALTLDGVTINAPEDKSALYFDYVGETYYSNDTLTLTVKRENRLTGGNSENNAGYGIEARANLTIMGEEESLLISTGGDSREGYAGYGMFALRLEINTEGIVKGFGGNGAVGGGYGIYGEYTKIRGKVSGEGGDCNEGEGGRGIVADGQSLIVESGSIVTAIGGNRGHGIYTSETTVVNINDSMVTATGGAGNYGIFFEMGTLNVSGDSCVVAQGQSIAAYHDGGDPDFIDAGSLAIREGEDEESSVIVEKYTGKKYLRIGEFPAPDDPVAPDDSSVPAGNGAAGADDLPQTGDASRMGLWCLLAGLSVLGMAALRARKEA